MAKRSISGRTIHYLEDMEARVVATGSIRIREVIRETVIIMGSGKLINMVTSSSMVIRERTRSYWH